MKFPVWPTHNGINKINLGLERINNLLEKLDHPERKIKNIFHVAGTNGKGSTTAFLKSILEANGYKVNRYTSPHLVRFNERIEILGKEITDDYFNELAEECKNVLEKYNIDASYFEIITTIAFMAFSRNEADATILEVGLGGRLDATNIIEKSLCSVITPISLDHTSILGDTLEKITMEKLAIAKNNCPMIISKQADIVNKTIKDNVKNSPLYFFDKDYSYNKIDNNYIFKGFDREIITEKPSLYGTHQIINAGASIAMLLCQKELEITDKAIQEGIKNTFWKGRLQDLSKTKLYNYVKNGNELFLDGAHNEGGARTIKEWLEEKQDNNKKNVLIISMLERKDTKSYINIIKNCFDKIIIVASDNYSSNLDKYKSIEDFTKEFNEAGCNIYFACNNIIDALKKTNDINGELRILIAGSLYFCGDVLSLIENY